MSTQTLDAAELEKAVTHLKNLRDRLGTAIFGQEILIKESLACLLARGHILMTGAPGLAKTTLVKVLAENLQLQFGRVQFTPDLLPSDITGADILMADGTKGERSFRFSPGPIFVNLLLADEINRAAPKTQSALLEAMQERCVTVGSHKHVLPQPFLVFATQNPFEFEGTFPLPEAQLDRFLLHSLVDYPSFEAEQAILEAQMRGSLAGEQWSGHHADQSTGMTREDLIFCMQVAEKIPLDKALQGAILDLVRSTRPLDPLCPPHLRDVLLYGAGPRAGIAMVSLGRAVALLEGSDTVRWNHLKSLAKPLLRHRIRLAARAIAEGLTVEKVVDELLERLENHYGNLARGLS